MIENARNALIVAGVVRHYPSVEGIYLFGSSQTESEWPDSDVDIAVLLPHDAAKRERRIQISECRHDLEKALGKGIDLVNLRLVSTVFQFQVVTTGRAIHIGDERAVDAFEMLTLSLYQRLNEERSGILREFYRTGKAYSV
ncbi:MAG: hypothetical protein A2Z34_10820 [Planctomycetes bacterium RBG_16_59_8]|nr:MAG: hypothetical protein A2Z34_10820 [Planctomycetes bacterium RBG_16_59_8]